MSDFPNTLVSSQQVSLSTFGPTSLCLDLAIGGGSTTANIAFPTVNLGVFTPVWVEQPVTAYKMGIIVGTQSGNVDVGIYNEFGTAVVRAGTTAVAAAGAQLFDITDTLLQPGVYFLAIACDNTTATFRATATSGGLTRTVGQATVASAFSSGLITPVTYAAPTVNYLPLVMASVVPTL